MNTVKNILFKETNNYSEALNVVMAGLKKDKKDPTQNTAYHAIQANIAMVFKDHYSAWKRAHDNKIPTNEDIHKIANDASTYFLDLLI